MNLRQFGFYAAMAGILKKKIKISVGDGAKTFINVSR